MESSAIDGTDRGQLLFNEESPANTAFRNALKAVVLQENPSLTEGELTAAVNAKIYADPVNGLAGEASATYARSLTGDVLVFAGDTALPGRTLNSVELPIVLENARSVAGLSPADARSLFGETTGNGSNALFDSIKARTIEVNAAGGFVEVNGSYTIARETAANIYGLENANAFKPAATLAAEIGQPVPVLQRIGGIVGSGLKVLGAAAIVYDTLTSAAKAADQVNAGDRLGAGKTLAELGARLYFGLEGAAAGAAWGAGLFSGTGPGALIAGFVGGIAGGVAGAIGGEAAVDAIWKAAENVVGYLSGNDNRRVLTITPGSFSDPAAEQLRQDLVASGIPNDQAMAAVRLAQTKLQDAQLSDPNATLESVLQQMVGDIESNKRAQNTYDETSSQTVATTTLADGSWIAGLYDSDGSSVGQMTRNTDGSFDERIYDSSGNLVSTTRMSADGDQFTTTRADGSVSSSGIAPNGAYWKIDRNVTRADLSDGSYIISAGNVIFTVHSDYSSTLSVNGNVTQFTAAQSTHLSISANSATVHTVVAAPNSAIDIKTFWPDGTPIVLTNASGTADNSRLDVGGGNWSNGAPTQQNPAFVDPRPDAPGGLGFASGAFHAATPNINANGYLPVAQNYLVAGNVNWARQTVQAAFDDFM